MHEVHVRVRTRNIKGVVSALRAIKAPAKQACCESLHACTVCLVCFDHSGLTVRWEHESKALHCSAHLAAETFSAFMASEPTSFGVRFGRLLDTLVLFTTTGDVCLEYPGPDAELVIKSVAVQGGVESTYAHLATMEVPAMQQLGDYWEEPTSHFIAPGATLREAVEDLEWAGGTARFSLTRDPAGVVLSSSEQSLSLQIDLPVDQLAGYSCQGPSRGATYSLKHLRTALAQPPLQDHTNGATKASMQSELGRVAMDARGLMKVTHLLGLTEGAVPRMTHPLHALQSQALAQAPAECVILFMVLPLEDVAEA